MRARHISLFVHPGKTAEVVHILTGLNQGGLAEVVATADLSLIERHYHGFQLWKHFTGHQGPEPPKAVCDCNLRIKTLLFINMYTNLGYRAKSAVFSDAACSGMSYLSQFCLGYF